MNGRDQGRPKTRGAFRHLGSRQSAENHLERLARYPDCSVDEVLARLPKRSRAIIARCDLAGELHRNVAATTNSAASQKARLTCVPIGEGNLSFGLGVDCSAGWYGYTGGFTGYNTGAYYMPATGVTIIAFVNSQIEKPFPGVTNAIFHDIAKIVTPNNIPFVK